MPLKIPVKPTKKAVKNGLSDLIGPRPSDQTESAQPIFPLSRLLRGNEERDAKLEAPSDHD